MSLLGFLEIEKNNLLLQYGTVSETTNGLKKKGEKLT